MMPTLVLYPLLEFTNRIEKGSNVFRFGQLPGAIQIFPRLSKAIRKRKLRREGKQRMGTVRFVMTRREFVDGFYEIPNGAVLRFREFRTIASAKANELIQMPPADEIQVRDLASELPATTKLELVVHESGERNFP